VIRAERQVIGKIGLESMGDVERCPALFQKWPCVVQIRLEADLVSVRSRTVIGHYLAKDIVGLQVQPAIEASANLNDSGVVGRERTVLQQVPAHDEGIGKKGHWISRPRARIVPRIPFLSVIGRLQCSHQS